jgi:drug/metabolite transporter (DMT)-like permease
MATIGTFAFSALMILGMRLAPATLGSVVMATTPAVTAAGAVLFLHDRLGRWQVLAFALAVAGVGVVEIFGGSGSGAGDAPLAGAALVFAAVCCEATYSLVGKRLTADLSPLGISVGVALVATAVFAPFAAWDAVHMSWGDATVGDWLAVLWWGAGTFALGSWLWFEGMKRTTPARASAFMAVMPVSALVLSYVLLGEAFRWGQVAGMGLVLAGLIGVVRSGASVH